MTSSRFPLLAGAGLLAVLALVGCAPKVQTAPLTAAPNPPAATADPEPSARVTDVAADCIDGVARLAGSAQQVSLVGSCARVEIEGTDLDVDLTRASVEDVVLRGDRNEVDAASVGSLSIEGTENDWEGVDIGSLSLRGDRNEIDLDGRAGAIAVAGNDNTVEAHEFGATDDNGQRNRFPVD